MKPRIFFCLYLITGITAIQLSAQLPILVRTKSFPSIKVWPDQQDKYSNNKQVDSLKISVTECDVLRFKHRKLVWENLQVFVKVSDNETDNKLILQENNNKQDLKKPAFRFHIIGKQGKAYIGSKKWNWISDLK
jgi:hypothetical protein